VDVNRIAVAIDGPSGAGKSTIARRVALSLGYIYVDTGALYRSIALYALRNEKAPDNPDEVVPLLKNIRLTMDYKGGKQHVYLNGEDVSGAIRSETVSIATSQVSAIPQVRAFLLDWQKEIAEHNNVVMDGRDIGTVVLPNAQVKIFLTASAEERARRRWQQYVKKGEDISFEEVLRDVVRRDEKDTNREISKLEAAPDAIIVDTTGNELERSISIITHLVREKLGYE